MIRFYTKSQIQHFSRFISQKITAIKVAVVGAYHGGNLGDMALGRSVADFLLSKNVKPGLQTIFNLEKWPTAPNAIIGGGAIGNSNSFKGVSERYKGKYQNVAIVGVDFTEKKYPESILKMIREASFVSCRSKQQADNLEKISGRDNIPFHPDLAFSLKVDFCRQNRVKATTGRSNSSKVLLINVLPLFADVRQGKIEPKEEHRLERPDLYENGAFKRMHDTYKLVIRELITGALVEGYRVETIPFTPQDEEYAEIILDGLEVIHTKYNPEPDLMLQKMMGASEILATRLHALIFALKVGKPFYPIAYSYKNEQLLESLGVDSSKYLSTACLAKGEKKLPSSLRCDENQIQELETASLKALENCFASLNLVTN